MAAAPLLTPCHLIRPFTPLASSSVTEIFHFSITLSFSSETKSILRQFFFLKIIGVQIVAKFETKLAQLVCLVAKSMFQN